jgi:hypothetical protein
LHYGAKSLVEVELVFLTMGDLKFVQYNLTTFVFKNLLQLFVKYVVARTEHDALFKSTTKIFSNFVAFSENPNFNNWSVVLLFFGAKIDFSHTTYNISQISHLSHTRTVSYHAQKSVVQKCFFDMTFTDFQMVHFRKLSFFKPDSEIVDIEIYHFRKVFTSLCNCILARVHWHPH